MVCVYLLAIVTDEYFVTSLDQIAEKWKLPHNVAGASLMAMGSSAPELSIALIALFKDGGAHSDVGIGTIVGSAVFNILVITGVSAIARPAKVTMRVVIRDVLTYLLSIILLIITFRDGTISIYEALTYIALYAVYITVLFNWKETPTDDQDTDIVKEVVEVLEAAHEGGGVFRKINSAVSKTIGVFTGNAHKFYIRAFVVSVIFIGVLSWFLVEYGIKLADALGAPPVIIALTVLAAGTSIPDLISSFIVAKQGRGEMAVSNAVGSNIFDILIGLGLPWAIAITAYGSTVHVATADLWSSTIILIGTVILLFIFLSTGRILSRLEGWILVSTYFVYIGWVWITGSSV